MSKKLIGQVKLPGDKSIAQRAVIFAALAEGTSLIRSFPQAGDPLSTLNALKPLGVEYSFSEIGDLTIKSHGQSAWVSPDRVLDLNNSGTGFRLLLGALAGTPNVDFAVLAGDQSLSVRPMRRLTERLQNTGAKLSGRGQANFAPIACEGQQLQGGDFALPVASAQLKTALLLSGLMADGETAVSEPHASRNHTELLLPAFGGQLSLSDNALRLKPSRLKATEVLVPGDFSAAAFFLVAGSLLEGSRIEIPNCGLNPTRTAMLTVLQEMGAKIDLGEQLSVAGEPIANLLVQASPLRGLVLAPELISNLIDEIPILALAMARAKGSSSVSGAAELKIKESDRLAEIARLLSFLGIKNELTTDGFRLEGNAGALFKAQAETYTVPHDHRIAMMAMIASLCSEKPFEVIGREYAAVSFPDFELILRELSA